MTQTKNETKTVFTVGNLAILDAFYSGSSLYVLVHGIILKSCESKQDRFSFFYLGITLVIMILWKWTLPNFINNALSGEDV